MIAQLWKGDKEEHRLEVEELGNVMEKVLTDFGKVSLRIGAVWLNECINTLREDVGLERRSRVR